MRRPQRRPAAAAAAPSSPAAPVPPLQTARDHEPRQLSARGRHAAAVLGQHVADEAWVGGGEGVQHLIQDVV
jgi:hypothetical protein